MTEELDVQTKRHKNLLNKIRKEHPTDERNDGHFGIGNEEIPATIGRIEGIGHYHNDSEGYHNGSQREGRAEGRPIRGTHAKDERTQRATGGSNSGSGQTDTTNIYPVESDDPTLREGGESSPLASPSPWELEDEEGAKEKSDRQKELARQRQQRHREKQRAETSSEASPLRDVEKKDITFSLKNIFKSDEKQEPDKPLLMKEADDETRRKLIDLYIRGSSLVDDVLEILVKDHESVAIWELSLEEAEMLVDMQLERARKSAREARVVRKLVAIYDRLFFAMLIGPRVKATLSHIESHGGISFK
jgi:hypothetical protein